MTHAIEIQKYTTKMKQLIEIADTKADAAKAQTDEKVVK